MAAFERRIADGFLYGDFQYAIDAPRTTSCEGRVLLLPPGRRDKRRCPTRSGS